MANEGRGASVWCRLRGVGGERYYVRETFLIFRVPFFSFHISPAVTFSSSKLISIGLFLHSNHINNINFMLRSNLAEIKVDTSRFPRSFKRVSYYCY